MREIYDLSFVINIDNIYNIVFLIIFLMFTNYNRNKNIVFSFLTIVQLKMSNYETILKYHNITYNRNGPNFFLF